MFARIKTTKTKEDEKGSGAGINNVDQLKSKLAASEERTASLEAEVAALKSRLEEETRAKFKLQSELDQLKNPGNRSRGTVAPSLPSDGHAASSPGLSVFDILEYILRPLKEDEVLALAQLTFTALASLHEAGSMHGNIDNRNVKIQEDGSVVLAHDHVRVTSERKFKPPEFTAKSAKTVTPEGDVYSLGVTLWSSADYLLEPHEEPDLSDDSCNLIGSMTDDAPDARPTSSALRQQLVRKSSDVSKNLLYGVMQEVSRKKAIRKDYEKQVAEHSRDDFKSAVLGSKSPRGGAKPLPALPKGFEQMVETEEWQQRDTPRKVERRKSKHLKTRLTVMIQGMTKSSSNSHIRSSPATSKD